MNDVSTGGRLSAKNRESKFLFLLLLWDEGIKNGVYAKLFGFRFRKVFLKQKKNSYQKLVFGDQKITHFIPL